MKKKVNPQLANRTELNKKTVIAALNASLGVVSTACKRAGVSRTQFYEWIKTDEEFKSSVDEISDIAIDFVESRLFKRIEDGDTTSIIFFLKTKGKARGYVERAEHINVDMTLPEWVSDWVKEEGKPVEDDVHI